MAQEAKHTPGTWVTHPMFPLYVVPAEHAQRPVGAHSDEAQDLLIYTQEIACLFADRHRPEAEVRANARLIAAAPDLLEALKWAANSIEAMRPTFSQVKDEGHAFHDQVLDAARLAIAKATGAA